MLISARGSRVPVGPTEGEILEGSLGSLSNESFIGFQAV